MYHWGGKEQWCKGSSPFALLLLPLRVRPHLTLLMLGHFKCDSEFVVAKLPFIRFKEQFSFVFL